MSKQSFNVDRTIKIHPNDPSTITNPKNGEILIDSTDSNKLKKYNESNSTWELLAAASSGTASGLQYIDATGSSDVITATFSPVIASLTDGLTILVGAQSANTTTTPTLNVNGLGAKTITKANNLPLVAGDIAASDHEMLLTYNLTLTVWVLHNPIYYPNATSATNIAGGAADSIPYQTAAGTTAFLAIGTQNQVLSVKSGVPAWGNYDPSNMILNPSFENATVGTSWTLGTNVTITATTTSANIADPSGTQAGLVTTSATVPFDIHQDITPPSGLAGTQGEMNWWLNVPAGITDGQVCPRVNGVVLTNYCISTFNDGAYHQYKIPFVFGTAGQTAGVQFKTTASYASGTQTVIVDLATLKAGLSGAGNLQLDNVYSAQITSSTTATNLNKAGWISCVNGGTGIATCTFGSGIFTAVPSCVVSTDDTSNTWARIASITGTSTLTNAGLQVLTLNVSGVSLVNSGSTIICQKSGNDYLASSSAVYSQASANYSRRSYTPTFTGWTASSSSCYESREGEYNDIDCSFVVSSVAGTEARVSLPGTNITSSLGTIRTAGLYVRSDTSTAHGGTVFLEPSVGYVTFSAPDIMGASSNTGTAKANGNAITATGTIFFHARVPISGWSNSAQIVGSFAGYTNVPGLYGGVDHFSASYGTTNSTTVCSASPCSYLDQIGTAITNITRIGVGQYVVNTPRTYAKLKCVFAPHDNASNFGAIFFNGGQCSNCNALTFSTASSGIGTGSSNYGDTWGNIMCDGQW